MSHSNHTHVDDLSAARILPACAHAFQSIAVQYAQLNERWSAMDRKLTDLSKAVVGNGTTRGSLAARVERLEAAAETAGKVGDRFWKIFGVAAAVAAVIVSIAT